MVAALLAIFAGAASAQTDEGKGQITAVNGMVGMTVDIVAVDGEGNSYDLGTGLDEAVAGDPAIVEPGNYTITFTASGSTVAEYDLTVTPVSAWIVVAGNALGAFAYPIDLDESVPVVFFANNSIVDVLVKSDSGDVQVPQGAQSDPLAPGQYTIDAGESTVGVDLENVADTSHTDVIAIGAANDIMEATVTIDDLAALKKSLEPATSQVPVPDVAGKTETEANTAITDAGLVAAATQVPDDTVPAGNVVSQDPAKDTMVDTGSTVNIVVSTGPDTPTNVPVPDVSGKTAADAQTELEAAGFTVTTEEQSSMDVEAGLVIETNPSAGTEVAPGTEVKMIVSSGAGEIIVPDLVGMTQDEATKAAEDAGLTIKFVEDADDPDPDGIIVSQDPAAGATAEAGSEVVAQLAPKLEEAWVILTLSPERVLTASGINFQPGSTVDLLVLETDKDAKATVQDSGSWAATADLSDVQNEAELLLVTGTAADGSAYESTFKIPAAGETTDVPTEAVPVEEESSGIPVWVWIILGLLVIGIIALGIKMFGGGDTTDDGTTPPPAAPPATGGDTPPAAGGDTPATDTPPTTDSN